MAPYPTSNPVVRGFPKGVEGRIKVVERERGLNRG